MNLVQTKNSINKLKKIRNIVGVSKFLTLQEISKVSKISKASLEMSSIARDIFMSAHEKYHLNLGFIKGNPKKPKLFIYVTFTKTLLSSSYDRIEKELLKDFIVGKDKLITIGEIASQFAKKNNIKEEYHIEEYSDIAIHKISALVSHLYETNKISEVSYALQTSRNERGILTILPVSKLNIETRLPEEKVVSQYNFYPSVVDVIENIKRIYILQNTTAILAEAKYFHLKEKLLRHEESISSIDKKIAERSRDLVKAQRKTQTEELILIFQNVKRNTKGGE